MIGINLITPADHRKNILDKESSDKFIIKYESSNTGTSHILYIIETTEEELLVLTLTYGKENVWIR